MDQLILLVVVGVIALVKWFVENAGKNAPDATRPTASRDPVAPRTSRPAIGDASRTETEEERMRRFMEALGLPSDAVPPPARKPPVNQPIQQTAPPVSRPLPTPRPSPRQLGRPLGPGTRPLPSSAPAHRPDIAPPLETGGPLPTMPKVASVGETAPSMEVTSIPQMRFAEPEQAVQSAAAAVSAVDKGASRSTVQVQPASRMQAALMEELRGPDALRKAILLREILGAPKGLQSAQSPSIFSPL